MERDFSKNSHVYLMNTVNGISGTRFSGKNEISSSNLSVRKEKYFVKNPYMFILFVIAALI